MAPGVLALSRASVPLAPWGRSQAREGALLTVSALLPGIPLLLGPLGPHPEPVLHHRLRFPQVSRGQLGAEWGQGEARKTEGVGARHSPERTSRVHCSADVSPASPPRPWGHCFGEVGRAEQPSEELPFLAHPAWRRLHFPAALLQLGGPSPQGLAVRGLSPVSLKDHEPSHHFTAEGSAF